MKTQSNSISRSKVSLNMVPLRRLKIEKSNKGFKLNLQSKALSEMKIYAKAV